MFLRNLSFLLLIIFFTSCDKFSFTKTTTAAKLDTIVDFTSVDTFPSFKECDSIIDKTKKATCFRDTIHQKLREQLQKHSFTVKDSIDETIFVDVLINTKGKVILEKIKSTENLKNQLSNLDSILKVCVGNLPLIYPAIKRGIPVTTQYQLPIRIQLKE